MAKLPSEQEDFGELWTRHEAELWRQARRQCLGNEEHAQEGLSATTVKLLVKHSQYDPTRGPWIAWAGRILRNTIIDEARKRARLPEQVHLDEDQLPPAPSEPEEPFDPDRFRTDFEDCLQRLPEEYRHLLTLCLRSGLSQTEAAKVLKRSDAWVSRHLPRAKEMLRDCLAAKSWSEKP